MLHKAWNSKGEMPYCFPRSSIKFQGHTGQNITDFDPNCAFPDYRPVAAFKSLRFALLQYQYNFPWIEDGCHHWHWQYIFMAFAWPKHVFSTSFPILFGSEELIQWFSYKIYLDLKTNIVDTDSAGGNTIAILETDIRTASCLINFTRKKSLFVYFGNAIMSRSYCHMFMYIPMWSANFGI